MAKHNCHCNCHCFPSKAAGNSRGLLWEAAFAFTGWISVLRLDLKLSLSFPLPSLRWVNQSSACTEEIKM